MSSNGRHPIKLLVFGASLRRKSLNDRLATLAASVVQEKGGTVDRAHMTDFDCPSYDQDVEAEGTIPGPARDLSARLQAADGFIISAPEYNASMPGVLKNVIDWVSRLRPQPFNGRQGLLLSASPSMVGGNRGLWALRVPFEHLGARIYPDMFSLAQAHDALDDSGQFADERLRQRFEDTVASFLDLLEASTHYPCVKRAWVEFLGERPDPAIDRVDV